MSAGPTPCPILFLGAGPAKTEAKTGIPYSGLAGDELRKTYLIAARMHDDDIHIGNATLCWDGTDRTPAESRVLDCANCHVPELLWQVEPKIVVLMGGVTQRICDMRIRLDMHHGIPQRTTLVGGLWSGWVVPMYEPALGMRETSRMTQLLEDFRRLGEWIRGDWQPAAPKDYALDYKLVGETRHDIQLLKQYISLGGASHGAWGRPEDDWSYHPPVDTEKHGSEPWSVQFSVHAHTGRLVRADNKRALEVLAAYLGTSVVRTVLHNAVGDLDTLEKLGVRVPRYRDTMQEAYHQCSLPQGLKPLAYRLFGANMRSWEDVVWPASVKAICEWMEDGITFAAEHLTEKVTTEWKKPLCLDCGHRHGVLLASEDSLSGPVYVAKKCGNKASGTKCGCESNNVTWQRTDYRPGAVERILTHLLTHTVRTEDDEEPYHPWKKLREMEVAGLRGKCATRGEWEAIEEACGPMPILGIGNCRIEEAVGYGCGDADWTGQVAAALKQGRESERWKVEKEDWDI